MKNKLIAILSLVKKFLINDEGQGLVEYSLIIALVALVAIASLRLVGTKSNHTLCLAGQGLKPTPLSNNNQSACP